MNKGEDLVQSMSRDDILNRFLMVSLFITNEFVFNFISMLFNNTIFFFYYVY